MNILLMLHISSAVLCLILVPVLYTLARRQAASRAVYASIVSVSSLIATGGILLVQASFATLPLFCVQTSSLFFVMYASYVLGQRASHKQTTVL